MDQVHGSDQQQGSSQQEVRLAVQDDGDKRAEESDRRIEELRSSVASAAHFEHTEGGRHQSTKPGGKGVAEHNREGIFESMNKANESLFSLDGVRLFSLDGVKKAAAWYIETSEKLANQAIEMQERATGWAKDTPLAPLFEAQSSFARKFVERSVSAARTLWQVQPASNS